MRSRLEHGLNAKGHVHLVAFIAHLEHIRFAFLTPPNHRVLFSLFDMRNLTFLSLELLLKDLHVDRLRPVRVGPNVVEVVIVGGKTVVDLNALPRFARQHQQEGLNG